MPINFMPDLFLVVKKPNTFHMNPQISQTSLTYLNISGQISIIPKLKKSVFCGDPALRLSMCSLTKRTLIRLQTDFCFWFPK